MNKLKIMYIINNLGVGGAEKVLLLLLEELSQRKDFDIVVVSLEGTGPLEAEFRKLPIKVKNFHYHLFTRHIHKLDLYFRWGLYRYIKRECPDIIQGQLMKGEDMAKLMGGLLGIPVVTTMHDVMIKPGYKQRFLSRFLTKAVAVSQPVANYLHRSYQIPKKEILVIPDAIRVEHYLDARKSFDIKNPVFIFVGRIFKHKGLEYAIRGLAKLVPAYPKMEFLVYGDAKFEQQYLNRLKKLVIKQKWGFVKFMGYTGDVPASLRQADIFVLPSKSEGFSMVVLEAAAAAKPIIATRTGAIPEMVEDGISGIFVKYADSEGIYTAAKRILDGDVEKMGLRSREIVKDKYSIEKVAEMYYNLYLEILNV